MKKIQEVLKNKSGQGVPMILAVVLCCLILACVTFEYMRLMIVAQGVRDSVQSAIVDVATENWDEAYAGLREGYSGGYQLAGSSWSQNVTSGNVYARLQDVRRQAGQLQAQQIVDLSHENHHGNAGGIHKGHFLEIQHTYRRRVGFNFLRNVLHVLFCTVMVNLSS